LKRARVKRFRAHPGGPRRKPRDSSLHLDMLRDLKRINGRPTVAAAPVLDRIGELLPSRLRPEPAVGEDA
jgi:phosphate:Na+ symporter